MRTSLTLAPVASGEVSLKLLPQSPKDKEHCQVVKGNLSTSTGAAIFNKGISKLKTQPPHLHQQQHHFAPANLGWSLHYVCACVNVHPSQLLHRVQQLVNFEGYYCSIAEGFGVTSSSFSKEWNEATSLLLGIHESYYHLPETVFLMTLRLFQRYLTTASVPARCINLVLGCCYLLAAEHWHMMEHGGATAVAELIPTREDLLLLLMGRSCYDLRDWDDWEATVRAQVCPLDAGLAFLTSLPLQYLNLFALGYGVSREMLRLLSKCLTEGPLATAYPPRVLAMSVFYSSVPTEQWDSLLYVQELAKMCAIPCQLFLQCCQEVMEVARLAARPSSLRLFTLLEQWRAQCNVKPDEKRGGRFQLDFDLFTIMEEDIIVKDDD